MAAAAGGVVTDLHTAGTALVAASASLAAAGGPAAAQIHAALAPMQLQLQQVLQSQQQLQQQLQQLQQQLQQLLQAQQQSQAQTNLQLLRLEGLAARGHNSTCGSGVARHYVHVPNGAVAALPAGLAPIVTLADLNALQGPARARYCVPVRACRPLPLPGPRSADPLFPSGGGRRR